MLNNCSIQSKSNQSNLIRQKGFQNALRRVLKALTAILLVRLVIYVPKNNQRYTGRLKALESVLIWYDFLNAIGCDQKRDYLKSISQKPNSSCAIDGITKNCITGAHNTKYYHPKVEEAFQTWLMKNQANQIGSVDEDEKGRKIVPTLGGNQEVWFLSENGVYEVFKN